MYGYGNVVNLTWVDRISLAKRTAEPTEYDEIS